jgi:hypothetical protein
MPALHLGHTYGAEGCYGDRKAKTTGGIVLFLTFQGAKGAIDLSSNGVRHGASGRRPASIPANKFPREVVRELSGTLQPCGQREGL